MDFRLKVFVTVADLLNFSAAAEQLGISQPAVTKHIKALESECNFQIFYRSGGKLRLSYEGSLLLEKAKRILSLYLDLGEESSLISRAPKGKFYLEIPPPIYYGFLPAFVGEVCRLAPHSLFEIKVTEISDSEQSESGEIEDSLYKTLNKITISYSSKPKEGNPVLFSDSLVVVGSNAFNPASYYNLEDLKFLNYTNDKQTLRDILEYFTHSKLSYSQVKAMAQLEDSQSIIRLLLSYYKHGKKAPATVAFLWKSQVAKFIKDGKLQVVNVHEFQDKPLPKRYYSINHSHTKESDGFVDFLTKWVSFLSQ